MSHDHDQRIDDKIDDKILESRRLFICDAIDNESAKETIRKLWYLELTDPGKPILLVINSPGGSTDAGWAIWDQMQMITSPIKTLVTGLAASFGSILSLAGGKGGRFATPFSRIMIHQPLISGVMQAVASDIEITSKEIDRTMDALVKVYCDASGRLEEEIREVLDRDKWMGPQEAIEFGILDRIVTSFDQIK
jgi:ATP-dependent Clp protease, protease subunit